ncbi:MAG: diguanylate cyclase [Corallococcus sp.]|nr:diguanylate cyclase [Corallococcus sp.]
MTEIKKKILIVDDSELNRSLLADMLSGDFDIMEAENGVEAVQILYEHELEISLMLLDIVMPQMDGFAVLSMMNKHGWIKTTPVIMISAETSGTYIDRAYDLGAIDYISRPFDERIVKHRVACNFVMSMRQHEMSELLSSQIYQKEKDNSLMIEILSNIVEFRNGESGMHVLHVNVITQMVLEHLVKMTSKYPLTAQEIRLISTASALHDIGKISIPSEILNKPGRFTPDEYEIMKRHTVEGANMLESIPFRKNEDLIRIGYQICRWHHERYDGKGYPDGLKGDEIPIAAQAVSLADVYDALTSERVYKAAYSPDVAVKMICNGECGQFNPLLLQCLNDLAPRLKEELSVVSLGSNVDDKIREQVKQVLKNDKTDVSARSIKLLERERQKFQYLTDISKEITFEYSAHPELLLLSEKGAETFGISMRILDPSGNARWNEIFSQENFADFVKALKSSPSDKSTAVVRKYVLTIGGQPRWSKVVAKAMWNDAEPPELEGAIGKIVDINDETEAMEYWENQADHDASTGLFNHMAAKKRISKLLAEAGERKYALMFFDIDHFKNINDTYGHLFGDEIIKTVADRMKDNTRSTDICARMGGDEFIIFMEYKKSVAAQVERIFKQLTKPYKNFDIRVSMGVACAEKFDGDYEKLFKMADTATYKVKKEGKNNFCFYDESMQSLMEEKRVGKNKDED